MPAQTKQNPMQKSEEESVAHALTTEPHSTVGRCGEILVLEECVRACRRRRPI